MNVLTGAIAGTKYFVVIDNNGNLKTITNIQEVKPGEVLLTKGDDPMMSGTFINAEIVEEDGSVTPIDVQSEVDQIIAQLEGGQDPTLLGEEFATAAGESSGSSVTPMAVVGRDGTEVIASTSFDTTGIESQGLSRTQSLQLLQQFINDAPTVSLSNLIVSIDENTPTNESIRVADINIVDDEQGINELSLSGTDADKFIIVTNADGTYELHLLPGVVLDFETLSSMDVSVNVSDPVLSDAALDTDSMTLGVNDVNEAPVSAVAINVTTQEDEPITMTLAELLADVLDPDNDSLTVSNLRTTDEGTVIRENADGTFTIIPGENFNGQIDLVFDVSDGELTVEREVNLTVTPVADPGVVTVEPITADDIINFLESQAAIDSNDSIMVSGTAIGGDIKVGDPVSMTINGTLYETTVGEGGVWSVPVEGSDLAENTVFTVNVVSTDGESTVTSSAISEHQVDIDLSVPTIDLIDSSDSGDSNTDNLTNQTKPTFALGNIDNDVSPENIVVSIDGIAVAGVFATVNGVLQFTPSVALAEEVREVVVTVTDDAGNTKSSAVLEVTIDTVAEATISIDVIAGDDIVNAAEGAGTVLVTGTVGGDAQPGDEVTLTVAGNEYKGQVNSDGTYRINVPGADLLNDSDKVIEASVSGEDAAGNSFTAHSVSSGNDVDGNYQVDVDLSVPTIDLIDSSDSGDSNTDNLTNQTKPTFALGNIDNDVSPENIVVSIDGIAVPGVFATVNGVLQFTPSVALAEEVREVVVTVTDDAGNTKSSAVLEVTIDTVAEATISIDVIAGDDIVNAAEGAGTVLVTGTVGGDAQPGDEVTLTVAGNEYKGQVNSDGTYRINVPGADLLNDSDKVIEASVSGEDAAGNSFTAHSVSSGNDVDGNYQVDVDLSVPTIDLIDSSDSGDSNTDNLTNQTKPTFALGNIDNDVSPENIVVSIDGIAVAGVFATVNGVLQFTPSVALAEEVREVVVTVTDDAGNTKSSAVLEVTIDTVAEATISIDVIAGDDIVNAAEGAGTVLVTGTVGGDAQPGDEVTLTVAGNEYKGQVNSDGTYRINVPGADLLNDSDKVIEASVSGEDAAGNSFTAHSVSSGNDVDGNYQVDVDLSVPTIDLIDSSDSGDSNTDNLTNQTKPTFALGNIDNDVSPENIVVSIDGIAVAGVFATVNGVLQFTPSVALAEEVREVVVTVTDDAGNTKSSAVLEVTIDTVAEATISIDVIAGDDIVNAAEGAGTVLVTGTVGGDAQPGDEVTLTVAGNEYKGQVNSDGTYRINVPGADLLNDSDKVIEASVSGEDAAGNSFTAHSVSSGNDVDGNYQVEDTPLVTIEGNGNDNIEGNDGNDVLVGDLGVRTGHSPTNSYNIAIIVDESSSMTREMPIVRSALSDLVANLASYQGVIHLSLIGFHSQAAIDIESTDISGDLLEIQNAIDGLTASGGTYYHTAFEKADAWFDSDDRVEGENKVIFLTDGKTRWANKAHEEFENLVDASENDVSVRAIAIDDGSSNWVDKLEEYDNTPIAGSDSGIEVVSDNDSIRAALDISTLKLDPAGNDTIRGNEGDDFILGDVINAANLWGGINNVPQSYENFTSEQLISIWMKNINGAEPTENEMNQFILANKDVLTASSIGETETGGNDFLYGGDGNDTIYGQVGNDELFGEEGNDLLSGGLGNDILTGGEGDDTFIWTEDTLDSGTDIIRDFQLNSDKIDISDLMDLSDPQKDSIDDILSSVTVDGTDVKIQFNTQSNNQTIVLEGGVTALGLDSSAYPDGSTVDLTSSLMDQVFKYD